MQNIVPDAVNDNTDTSQVSNGFSETKEIQELKYSLALRDIQLSIIQKMCSFVTQKICDSIIEDVKNLKSLTTIIKFNDDGTPMYL